MTTDHLRYRIAAYRARNGLTQDQLAAKAGISREYLSMIENGRRAGDRYTLLTAIAHALGIDITALTATTPGATPSTTDAYVTLRLNLWQTHANIEPATTDSRQPIIVLTDGAIRIELTGHPKHLKQARNAAVHIRDTLNTHLRGHTTPPAIQPEHDPQRE